ncbi:sphingomyelin phosphodiesterase isoform X2 [Wolffia australiana]
MNAQERAQHLATTILSSSSAAQIAAACTAVEDLLRCDPSNQARPFFSLAFPALLSRLFGFEPSSPSWIDHPDSEVSARVLALLSPRGVLLSSISAVDKQSPLKFIFPVERLPDWMRFVLQTEKRSSSLQELCPLFKSRVQEDAVHGSFRLQLSVFEYFIFWFAYYPVCRGKSENSDALTARKTRRFIWASSWPSLASYGSTSSIKKKSCGLYLKLLYEYLQAFVPNQVQSGDQPYRCSLFHDSSALQAEFLICALAQFWIVDNDFSPLPKSLCSSLGVNFPFQRLLVDNPPSPGLGEVIKLMITYLNSSGQASFQSSLPISSVIQRPLYRFILRSFLFCPVETSMDNACQVISLWASYLEPWLITPDVFLEFEVCKSELAKEKSQSRNVHDGKEKIMRSSERYSSSWLFYVTSNYLFYNSLFVHFLGFAHKILHNDAEKVVSMVLKVLNILTSSKELMGLLKSVEAAYHSRAVAHSDAVLAKLAPTLRQQLQDWEDGLCETEADGSLLHESSNRDLRLFSEGEDGAHWLLQLFVLRAEAEIRRRDGPVHDMDRIQAKMGTLFSGPRRVAHHQPGVRVEAHAEPGFSPKHPGGPKWAEVKYKGDWMRRPISEGEVAWLARLLINISARLNEWLGLDPVATGVCMTGSKVMDLGAAAGPRDILWMVLTLVSCWLGSLGQTLAHCLNKRRARINLRPLASKKLVLVVVLSIAVAGIRRLIGRV